MSTLLRAEQLHRRFGDHVALDDFTMEVDPGTIVGVIGPSGGGKTTAVRLCCGLDRPDRGEVRLFGKHVGELGRSERQRMALLSQTPALVEEMTILQQVRFAAELYGLRTDGVDAALDRVGLADKSSTRISQASGGMRRRTGLAAALIIDPELVFCDEPTAGLDPILRERIWRWFRARRSQGRAMVVTTQHIEEAARCDRVIVLREGVVIANTEPAHLASSSGLPEQVVVGLPTDQLESGFEALGSRFPDQVSRVGDDLIVATSDGASAAADVTAVLHDAAIVVESVDTVAPGLNDVFRAIVESDR